MKKILRVFAQFSIWVLVVGFIANTITGGIVIKNKVDNLEKQNKELIQVLEQSLENAEEMYSIIINGVLYLDQKNEGKIDAVREEAEPLPYEYIKSVTVRLEGRQEATDDEGWLGTGIIVKVTEDYTYILTNKHVAPIGTVVKIDEGDIYYDVEILKNSAFYDLSLVRMNGSLHGKGVVTGFAKAKIQEKVFAVGMYLGEYFIYSEGTVAGKSITGELLINAPSAPGCSGSGVFNSEVKVIGLLFAGYRIGYFQMDTTRAICVPASAIKIFLAEYLN